MSLRVGDTAFMRGGSPTIVRDRDPITGKLQLESDTEKIKEDSRHGYLNGITPENRQVFYDILDQVKSDSEDPEERVTQLAGRLAELDQDPHNMQLAKYLRAEMVHIMNTHAIKPKEYSVHETKLR